MANDGTGTGWDTGSPANHSLVSNLPTEVRDLRLGAEIRLNKEHVTLAAASVGGEHLAGSAKVYFSAAASPPTLRPDGLTGFTAADAGRMFVESDTLKLKVLDASQVFQRPYSAKQYSHARLCHSDVVSDSGGLTGGAQTARLLNTESYDPDGIVSLTASTSFILAAGTYIVRAGAPARKVGRHRIRLYNVTDAAEVVASGLP